MVKVDVLRLQIKVVKQMSRTYPRGETNTHLVSNDIKDIGETLFCSYSSKSLAELEFKKVAGRVVYMILI
jgi:hypothetical protein